MKKKAYKIPTLKSVDIADSELIATSPLNAGYINTDNDQPTKSGLYETVSGYDKENGGWGTGTPD